MVLHFVFSRFITLDLELLLLLVPLSQLCHQSCCKEPCPRARCHQKCSFSITWRGDVQVVTPCLRHTSALRDGTETERATPCRDRSHHTQLRVVQDSALCTLPREIEPTAGSETGIAKSKAENITPAQNQWQPSQPHVCRVWWHCTGVLQGHQSSQFSSCGLHSVTCTHYAREKNSFSIFKCLGFVLLCAFWATCR